MHQAEEKYIGFARFDPYDPEVCYQLAKGFAGIDTEKTLRYLIEAYDIDPIYLDLARKEKAIARTIGEAGFENILSKEISRMWNVIDVNQIDPKVLDDEIILRFNKHQKDEVMKVFESFEEPVSDWFNWKDRRPYHEEPIDYFIIKSNCDRRYVHYGRLFLAFKLLSPFCKDIRFLMSSEPVSYVDEIMIWNGVFYSYRHEAKGSYWDNKINVIAKLADQYLDDINLRKFVSCEYIGRASL